MPVEEHNPFEEQFAEALRDTGTTFAADRQDLAARGEAHGRRLRARRRVAVVGGATGVVLLGLGGAFVLPGGHADQGAPQRPVGDKPVARATSSAVVAATPVPVNLVDTLEKLLPKGTFSHEESSALGGQAGAQVVYDDGRGKAAVAVSLSRVAPGSEEARQYIECPDKVFVTYDSCTSGKLPDGSSVTVLKGYERPSSRSGTKLWQADLVTSTGQHVTVQEWNAAAEKGSPATRSQPPLSAARLKDLADAREWRDAFGAVPTQPRTTVTPRPPQDTQHVSISSTLAGLLPKGLKVVSRSNDEGGFGYVVVDDGRGSSLVQVNVQPDMNDVRSQLFGEGATKLADGTEVVQRKQGGEKGISGIAMWTVDTIRPDGFRVVISAFNSGSQTTPATRATPAPTMAQLQRIATDPKWLTMG